MLTLTLPRQAQPRLLVQVGSIAIFAIFTALSARISIPWQPVPFTMQVIAVLLAGMILGARAGAASQVAYLLAATAGLPITAAGIGGPSIWLKPTAGYLIGFVIAAWLTGWLAEQGFRRGVVLRWLAALAGVAALYAAGATWLTIFFLGGNWGMGWERGIAPFLLLDMIKAIIVAMGAEALWQTWGKNAGFGDSARRS